jgi:hypothetical protein
MRFNNCIEIKRSFAKSKFSGFLIVWMHSLRHYNVDTSKS